MSAALDVVLQRHQSAGRLVRLRWPRNSSVANVLRRNGFLADVKLPAAASMMPHRRFHPTDKIGFEEYADEHLKGKGIPRMTIALRDHFMIGLHELFGNVDLHAATELPVCVAGQAYPAKQRLLFTLADAGIGIRECIHRRLKRKMACGEAINWAVSGNNTTRGGDVPGGLGLKIVREFVELNKGTLTIVSESGYWQQVGKTVNYQEIPYPFPGTVIALEIRTNDTTSYSLRHERQQPVQF